MIYMRVFWSWEGRRQISAEGWVDGFLRECLKRFFHTPI
jgi:hypothetical protein